MALTHLSRKGSQALRIKVDVEAALLSSYESPNQAWDSPRSTNRLQSRLQKLISKSTDPFSARSLIHGYMFDAWSSRECQDLFLSLNTRWELTTDLYLALANEMNLQDFTLPCLLTVSRQERIRLLQLLLKSPRLSAKSVEELFLWSVDEVYSESCSVISSPGKRIETDQQHPILGSWTDLLEKQETLRSTLHQTFRNVMTRTLVRLSTVMPDSTISTGAPGTTEVGQRTKEVAVEMIAAWVKDIFAILLKDIMFRTLVAHQHKQVLLGWMALPASCQNGLSEMISAILEADVQSKKRALGPFDEVDELEKLLANDALFTIESPSRSNGKSNYTHTNSALDSHARTFLDICRSIRLHQDSPGFPPTKLSRLEFAEQPSLRQDESITLKEQVAWVESIIASRSGPWRSCVKLKLQFFAVFPEESINEDFANLIGDCDLHWELCTTLHTYLKRHLVDKTRLPLTIFQLGCELLLAVYTKKESQWKQLRDHLYVLSRSVFPTVSGPLFGSWDYWRIDIDTQLVVALNQLVAVKGLSTSIIIPSHVKEALIKISLIAPYQVLLKIVQAASMNRGQCTLLLKTLQDLGQLAWLRTTASEQALLVTVVHHLICETKEKSTWTQPQLDNFAEFLQGATMQESQTGQCLLDKSEFLVECAVPLLKRMAIQEEGSIFFKSVAIVLTRLYESSHLGQPQGKVDHWLHHEVHAVILLYLLDLESQQRPTILGKFSPSYPRRRCGGPQFGEISRLCELIISALTKQVQSLSTVYRNHLVRQLWTSIRHLQNPLTELSESTRLLSLPLLRVVSQHTSEETWKPELDQHLSIMCGKDQLEICRIAETDDMSDDEDTNTAIAHALVILLHYASLGDDIASDLIKAVKSSSDQNILQEQPNLQIMIVPALYRVLSTCSSQQCQRLLVNVVPKLIMVLRGSQMGKANVFGETDTNSSDRPYLGPYWNKFIRGQRTTEDDHSQGGAKNSEGALLILTLSESLLRLALDPYTRDNRMALMSVYGLDIGYDLSVDQVASLIPVAAKSLQRDLTKSSLDYVLYYFMFACKLCFVCSTDLAPTILERVHASSGPVRFKKDPSDEDIFYALKKSSFSRNTLSTVSERKDTQAKACAELLLMAMNISEEIVARQDAFYRRNDPPMQESSTSAHATTDTNKPKQGKNRHRKNKNKHKSNSNNHGRDGEDATHGDAISAEAMDHSRSRLPEDDDNMDGATKAWLTTVMGSGPSTKLVKSGETKDFEVPTKLTEEIDTVPMDLDPSEPPAIDALLNSDQIDCLRLAISYLPPQEKQAVEARLRRLLETENSKK
ncbi:hypothetical protein BGZ83_004222 [Gryganskiella cystojenkinii]|nr:hypothetical protein BGZ83_004222 [Gryganskiella cystojenkinii]